MITISFNPVSSKKLYIQIYNQIVTQIESGAFQIGDKLPAERELCEQFGVSRAPIRQALSALELNGYIYSRQGEGVYVKSNHPSDDQSSSSILLDSISPEDIVEARMTFEPLIIRFAALRATEEHIEELDSIINQMEKETLAGQYVSETDAKLHNAIAKASQNDLFINFMTAINNAMDKQEMWKLIRDRTVTHSDYREINFKEHQLMIQAIKDHNEVEAEKLMRTHMENLFKKLWKDEE